MSGLEFTAQFRVGNETKTKPTWLNKDVVTLVQPDEELGTTLIFTNLTDKAFMAVEPYSSIVGKIED